MSPAVLVNVVGFFLGAVLYGMLLAMALGAGVPAATATEAWAARWRSPASRLMILTGLLGLLWNLGALIAYGFSPSLRDADLRVPLVIAFSALGFLPAVVVHSVLTRQSRLPASRAERLTFATAYALSSVATIMHLRAALLDLPVPSVAALTLLTAGFVVLILALLITAPRRGQDAPGYEDRWHAGRAIWVAALSVFVVSAVHLAQHTGGESWWTEVLGHHASLLLALAILNRDYRFAFADIFLKRALTLTLLLASVLAVHLIVGLPWLAARSPDPSGVQLTTYVLVLALLTASLQSVLRRTSAWFVDTVILRRPDYAQLPINIAGQLAQQHQPEDVFRVVTTQLAEALDATWVRVAEIHDASISAHSAIVRVGVDADALARRCVAAADTDPAAGAAATALLGPHAALIVPTVEAPRYVFLIGQLLGGRRLLSDDLTLLESIAVIVARRLDALRVAQERVEATVREQQISRLATEAELRALRAQLNPHFLFNALTTVGYLIQTAPDRAMDTLLRLTSLLRGVLRRTTNEFSTLGDELDLIEAYLEIEHARFEERLRVTIDVAPALRTLSIPSLLVQPLVENAVKHGIAPSVTGGEVIVAAFLESDAAAPAQSQNQNQSQNQSQGDQLRLSIRDTGVGTTDSVLARGRARGVGISSVEHRLRVHYGAAASLRISSLPEVGTTVDLVIPVFGGRKGPAAHDQASHSHRG
jgi:two-component system LytT family sensor kinase